MIQFNYLIDYDLKKEDDLKVWILKCIEIRGFKVGEINYIFCDDDYLLKLNLEFLKHNTLTDIISFDYTLGKLISGDIYISVERVKENALEFNQQVDTEINRVMVHGVLHYMGYKDKFEKDVVEMREEEECCLKLLGYMNVSRGT